MGHFLGASVRKSFKGAWKGSRGAHEYPMIKEYLLMEEEQKNWINLLKYWF